MDDLAALAHEELAEGQHLVALELHISEGYRRGGVGQARDLELLDYVRLHLGAWQAHWVERQSVLELAAVGHKLLSPRRKLQTFIFEFYRLSHRWILRRPHLLREVLLPSLTRSHHIFRRLITDPSGQIWSVSYRWSIQGIFLIKLLILLHLSGRSICFSLFDGDILRCCRIWSFLTTHQRNLLLILLILFLAPNLHALTLN